MRLALEALLLVWPNEFDVQAFAGEQCDTCIPEYTYKVRLLSETINSQSVYKILATSYKEGNAETFTDLPESVSIPIFNGGGSSAVRLSNNKTAYFTAQADLIGGGEGIVRVVTRDSGGNITQTQRLTLYVAPSSDDSDELAIGEPPVRPSGTPQTFQTIGTTLPVALELASSIQIGSKVYLIGGETPTEVTDKIYEATINNDGSLSNFTASTFTLTAARKGARVERIGNFVYIFGGFNAFNGQSTATPLSSIEVATCDNNGLTSNFSTASQTLDEGRYNFLTLVTKGYVYALGGGVAANFQSNSVARATINTTTGELTSNFIALSRTVVNANEVTNGLVDTRWTHNGIRLGNNFYILGGESLDTIERVQINEDGTIGNFVKLAGTLNSDRNRLHVVALRDRAYVFSGWNGNFLTTVESAPITNNELGSFIVEGGITLDQGVENGSALLTSDAIYLFGGSAGGPVQNIIQRAAIQ